MPRAAFYDAVRESPFGGRLSRGQVEGMEIILDEWLGRDHSDSRWLAYMLATVFHETARTMQPIRERGGAAYFRRMYDPEGARPHVARALGNTEPGDGARFCGRGFVQLTGRANYRRMAELTGHDLVDDPDKAMAPAIATEILFEGMIGGHFTGHALGDHFNAETADWNGARRIVNGTDRAAEIAGYGRAFHAAAELLDGDSAGSAPDGQTEQEHNDSAFLTRLLAFLRAVFTGGKR